MPAILSVFLLCLLVAQPLHADPVIAEQHMTEPKLVGKARLKVMFWRVFDAELYAPEGSFRADRPYALSLSYLREIESADIVSKSMAEIKRQGRHDRNQLANWRTKLVFTRAFFEIWLGKDTSEPEFRKKLLRLI